MQYSRGRQFKNLVSCKTVLDSLMVQYLSSHLHFSDSLNLEPHISLADVGDVEVGGCEINIIM